MYIIGVQKHFANDVYFDFVKLRRFKSNYGPISLISCFSKVFTSIINNILASYADQEQLISESQKNAFNNIYYFHIAFPC